MAQKTILSVTATPGRVHSSKLPFPVKSEESTSAPYYTIASDGFAAGATAGDGYAAGATAGDGFAGGATASEGT